MSATERRWAERLGRLGYGARGVVFLLIGAFMLLAAWRGSPDEARGLGGSLATLAAQPYGPWLLGLVALGLLAYAVFLLIQARYSQMVVQ
jgi:hypothetical protein